MNAIILFNYLISEMMDKSSTGGKLFQECLDLIYELIGFSTDTIRKN